MTDEEILVEMENGCLTCHLPWIWYYGVPFCPNCLTTPTPAVPKGEMMNDANILIQTRNDDGAIYTYDTLGEAFAAAKLDRTIWKISFNAANGERIRLITRDKGFTWLYEPIIDQAVIVDQARRNAAWDLLISDRKLKPCRTEDAHTRHIWNGPEPLVEGWYCLGVEKK